MNPSARCLLIALVLLAPLAARTEPAPTEFPADAVAPTAEALEKHVSGNAFDIPLADGSSWRFSYFGNKQFHVSTHRGFNATGQWSVRENQVCTDGQKLKASCNATSSWSRTTRST